MVVYHGRCPRRVRAAATLHLGRRPPDLAPAPCGRAAGSSFVLLGTDHRGRAVGAVVQPSDPRVLQRALPALAEAGGLSPGSLLPVAVPAHAGRAALRALVEGAQAVAPPPPGAGPGPLCYVYFCYGGAHTSVTAANIHLGRLPAAPSWRAVVRQPYFDRSRPAERGILVLMGCDDAGARVYCLGLGPRCHAVAACLGRVLGAAGVGPDRLRLVGVLCAAGLAVRLGGLLSRRCGLVLLGRPLCAWGIGRAHARLAGLVAAARSGNSSP